ncbi:MAG: hypothetical protein CMP24_03560 [Rickettsiales bacterium]|nr:hypothetical protein [Rickettsiales bacterium]
MKNNKKALEIISKMKPYLISNKVFNLNIEHFIKKQNISLEDFYTYFPESINSMSITYFENITFLAIKNCKKTVFNEKSISRKITQILKQNILIISKEKELSQFFIRYLTTKPRLLLIISNHFAHSAWREIKDNSTDFNYYTKRIILSKIYLVSLYYWKKTLNISDTNLLIERQISSIKILAKIKDFREKLFNKIIKNDFLKYLDFKH